MRYFCKRRDIFDFAVYCTQGTSTADPMLNSLPCPAFGCIPNDPRVIQMLNSDPGRAHNASYGNFYIDEVIKQYKPTIWVGSDDIWAFGGIRDKPWFKQINSVYHITVDSIPVLEEAYNEARSTPYFFTWAKFAVDEMKKYDPVGCAHVDCIYGAFDTTMYYPISKSEKANLRRRFGLGEDETIFMYLSRNQLRKNFPQIIEAFAEFKKEFPFAKARLHFHTSFSERGNGWDIPKQMALNGLRREDVLCTYVCRNCSAWHVSPYGGEDVDCPYCGTKKSMITANIHHGVPDEEMPLLYGLADASPNAFTSGGLERGVASALLCGLPVAVTNYSCGIDYCKQSFVHALDWFKAHEAGTNFYKASTSVKSLKNFFVKIHKSTVAQRQDLSERGRDWALKTFSTDVIGAQWEKVFDSMPHPDWSTVTVDSAPKNPNYPMPVVEDNNEFITLLYRNILGMEEPENGDGRKNWMTQLNNGATREHVYRFFIDTALKENAKNIKIEFSDLIDKNTGKKRALFLIKESIGDCFIVTSLFRSFHEQYPDHDLYVMTSPQYFEVFEGNPYVYKVLPYIQEAEQEMIMGGAGQKEGLFDQYFHPGILTQRQLQYLFQSNPLEVK